MAEYAFNETLLKVQDVSLKLGDNQILRDVNVEIKNITRPGVTTGQVVGFLGPSGMGKTQLFRIISGLNQPDKGEVLVGPEAIPVRQGMMGVVSQHYPLFEHRTVLSNLVIAGQRAGLSANAARTKARELLQHFDLGNRGELYPIQLSGGQRQRVAIAQQFMCSDHFLLMDEPFSGLDPLAIKNVCGLINHMASDHDFNTIIVVTHDVASALEVADTIWLLGRDRDAQGNIIPGARIQATYNLIEKGLAWRDGIRTDPTFIALMEEIHAYFPRL